MDCKELLELEFDLYDSDSLHLLEALENGKNRSGRR